MSKTFDFDFHNHTAPQSDCATQSITELVNKARDFGITTLALTNHDTLDGLDEAKSLCDRYGITLINGVELTCHIKGESSDLDGAIVHILGHNVDNDPTLFNQVVAPVKNANEARVKAICQYLRDQGHDVDDRTRVKLLAEHLVERKVFADVKSANDYLYSDEIEQLFPTHRLTHKEGIALIHQLHGIAVWAHPLRIWQHAKFTADELRDVVDRFCACGLNGLEVFHPNNLKDSDGVKTLLQIAADKNLLITLGSDTHEVDDVYRYAVLVQGLNDFRFDAAKLRRAKL